MNGLSVKIIYPKDGKIHVDDEQKRFAVHIQRDGDPAFNRIKDIFFQLRSLQDNKVITTRNIKPVVDTGDELKYIWKIDEKLEEGSYEARAVIRPINDRSITNTVARDLARRITAKRFDVLPAREPAEPKRQVKVSLQEARRIDSPDQLLWILIRNRTIKFDKYEDFINGVLCGNAEPPREGQKLLYASRLPFHNVATYSLLKYATEYYLMQECGLVPQGLIEGQNWEVYKKIFDTADEQGRTARAEIDMAELKNSYLKELTSEDAYSLPYMDIIRRKLSEVPLKQPHEIYLDGYAKVSINACYGILKSKLLGPCMLELIWSYWHEEGGLVQTMNAISRRFQNIRNGYGKDPLANFNLDPLRPLNNLLWGYIEDERNRLSMSRRNLEYQYEYGISLIGKAVPQIGVAEHRTNFIRAFHNLLKVCIEFYNQANFTTVIPDGFPLLNHLREVHLLLAEGAHNQYGDLPWTSRIEMLIQQWLLSRTEMREFIGGRIMVPYAEPWMDKVDTMKTLQGWNDTNITHFHDLGVFGEQLLLSIRFGNWNDAANVGATNAANWAHYWRNEVQRYVHAYNAVTGVDLSADITDARVQLTTAEDRYTPPAILIQKQASLQKSRQQYALQGNGIQPALLPNTPVTALPIQPIPANGQKKLNG